MKVCTAGVNPKCDYKRNAKGTPYQKYGQLCVYELPCSFQENVEEGNING